MPSRRAIAALRARILETPRALDIRLEPLSDEERRLVVETFITVIEGLYSHLPGKRARYGHDPVQRLRSLQQQLKAIDEETFHRSISQIITDLRDAHTRYIGPRQVHGQVAFLPILLERYEEGGRDQYVVSKIFVKTPEDRAAFEATGFEEGVRVTHWNGVPVARAVDLYADRETGGRQDARRARALESLTFRPLRYTLFPDEDWVTVTFIDGTGKRSEQRLTWQVVGVEDLPKATRYGDAARMAYAGDPAAETVQRLKKMLFATEKWYLDESGETPGVERGAEQSRATGEWFTGRFADMVSARIVKSPGLPDFGLLRLWSFDLRDDEAFVDEVIELLGELPRTGLVIDLRGNPGGLIWAAERLLQIFTANPVEPTRFAMLATDLTRSMVEARQNQAGLAPWQRSVTSAVVTGELYSREVPLTPVARCNDIGQKYPGPVVGVVDANTYSAGDLFAAGLVDNGVGALVSVDRASGGGGANVWSSGNVHRALAGTERQLPRLPKGIDYTVSFRRAVRIGDVAGTGIEDLGVPGQIRYSMTRRDLTDDNADLLAFCGRLLASEPFTDLATRVEDGVLKIKTVHLDRVDIYVDAHPRASLLTGSASGPGEAAYVFDGPWYVAEVIGFQGDLRRQQRLLRPEGV